MATKRFTREYPDTWSIQKIADFIGDCRRTGRIPDGVQARSKKLRNGMIRVTWKWKV